MYGYKLLSNGVFILALFIDNAFAILYLSIFFYSIFNRKKDFLWFSLVLFGISMYMYGFDTGGKPKGYFLDTLGVYSAIFSLFIFLYFIYTIYRILIKEDKNILWYISFTAFLLSLLLSLRQKIIIEDFAPFVVVAVPLLVRVFFNSYRVRLPQHRKYHNISFLIVLFSLIINLLLSYFNKPLYTFLKEPHKHFAYKYHVVKELAEVLKEKNITNIQTDDARLALRLKFYGIGNGGIYKISHSKFKKEKYQSIDIKYFDKIVKTFYLYR